MKKENLYIGLTETTNELLNMAKGLSFTEISKNCLYIISEIKNGDINSFERNKVRIRENSGKIPRSLLEILPHLEVLYPDFYDVNLYVYKANKRMTIIEIQYYRRSSLDLDYREKTQFQETMLHCKVALPPYHSNRNKKFDINWEFNPVNHRWKMFWWRHKINRLILHRVKS